MRAKGKALIGKAMETVEMALEVEPEHIDCWGDLASLAYLHLKQGIAGSRGVLLRARAANPSSLELRESFIEMCIDYGELNEAERVLDETNAALERGDVIEDSQEDKATSRTRTIRTMRAPASGLRLCGRRFWRLASQLRNCPD